MRNSLNSLLKKNRHKFKKSLLKMLKSSLILPKKRKVCSICLFLRVNLLSLEWKYLVYQKLTAKHFLIPWNKLLISFNLKRKQMKNNRIYEMSSPKKIELKINIPMNSSLTNQENLRNARFLRIFLLKHKKLTVFI